jgi:hypothetical protein
MTHNVAVRGSPTRPSLAWILQVLIPTAVLVSGASAQQPAPPTTKEISGFLRIHWGGSAQDVINAFGSPMVDKTNEGGNRVLVYKDRVVNRPALALFYVDQQKGLMKGIYSVSYGPGNDCEALFHNLTTLVERTFGGGLRPLELRTQSDEKVPFCDAAARGKASWSVTWTEAGSGNSVRVNLEPEGKLVDLIFQSGSFRLETGKKQS